MTNKPIPQREVGYARKWPLLAREFTQVPSELLEHQQCLGVKDGELMVYIRILKHWFTVSKLPYPSIKTLGKIGGRSESAVIRHLNGLEKKGLIARIKSHGHSSRYDPRPMQNLLVNHMMVCKISKQKYKAKAFKTDSSGQAEIQVKEEERKRPRKNTNAESIGSILKRRM